MRGNSKNPLSILSLCLFVLLDFERLDSCFLGNLETQKLKKTHSSGSITMFLCYKDAQSSILRIFGGTMHENYNFSRKYAFPILILF